MAVMLFVLFALFLGSSLWNWEEYLVGPMGPVFYTHIAVTVLLALVAQRLCVQCDVFLKHLRITEFLIVGGTAAFLLLFNHFNMLGRSTNQFKLFNHQIYFKSSKLHGTMRVEAEV